MKNKTKARVSDFFYYLIMCFLALVFLAPIIIVLYNSFKGQLFVSANPFALPTAESFVGLSNYSVGIARTDFSASFLRSLFITLFSVAAILVFCSMTAWFIHRAGGRLGKTLYLIFISSMLVPFQMVMFTMSKVASDLSLDNLPGIVVIYLGFGAGLAVFLFYGFVGGVPLEVEEAAQIDGCSPLSTFFRVVFPLLRPILTTVAILDAMWIYNDYLLPYLVIGTEFRTVPIAVQYLEGGYGSRDIGALMALLVLSVIPVVVFYLFAQKEIIKGVAAGAVKG